MRTEPKSALRRSVSPLLVSNAPLRSAEECGIAGSPAFVGFSAAGSIAAQPCAEKLVTRVTTKKIVANAPSHAPPGNIKQRKTIPGLQMEHAVIVGRIFPL